ncbi:MAG TPA: ABC transporter permease [Candidatus Hydrogenedentes bacterium]|nr:ABC transporter permease [Candidatus Hydrogenedentota bacterium]HPG65457.1 ABC transporter permease [Candidatus Hydrogenedentota bacterium]
MAVDGKARAGIERQISLPNREAVRIALRSLRIRIWRSLITVAGIVLAIAFLSSVITSGIVSEGIRQVTGAEVGTTAQERATQIWLISISLLVCVVGITNAMLMSVTERYREIGTMKCLGALDWFVVKLFLLEAGFLGLAGSLVGALVGFLAAVLAAMAQHDSVLTSVPWSKALGGLAGAIAVGGVVSVIGAVYPARRAGRMPPADAMRTEI